MQFDGIAKVLDLENLSNENEQAALKAAIANGYYPERSGDIYVQFEPGWFEGMAKGTTHGSVYPYDTHIPLVWMGWHVTPRRKPHRGTHDRYSTNRCRFTAHTRT
jgi:hypothetical protein